VRVLGLLLAAAGTVFAAAGCSKTLELEDAEETFAAEIERRTGAQVAAVVCPDDVRAEAGAVFRCTVAAGDGSQITVDVIQTSDDANVRLDASFVRIPELESGIQSRFEVSGVDCPDLVRLVAGVTIACTGRASGDDVDITVTINDAEGTDVDVEIHPVP
jgi:hypothetical protein